MKVLYISDRSGGGIVSHVKCLTECLPPEVERYVIGSGGDEPFAGKSGHDFRELFQIRRVMKTFKPDVVHFHIPNLFMALYIRLSRLCNLLTLKLFNFSTFQPFNLVCSWHLPSTGKMWWKYRVFFWLLGKDCYYLPVSTPTWEGLKKWLPYAKGEVFFNPVKVEKSGSQAPKPFNLSTFQPFNLTVGMVGRNAPVKDWPSFHKVEKLVKEKVSRLKGFKVSKFRGFEVGEEGCKIEFLNAGEKEFCDGREAIRGMDLFLLTSISEEMPTVVLECFLEGTPICGFVPKGGMSDILAFSKGSLREAFIAERDCDKLSDIVIDLLEHPEKRQALVEDGRQILEGHFDAEKNVKGRLMEIYSGDNKGSRE